MKNKEVDFLIKAGLDEAIVREITDYDSRKKKKKKKKSKCKKEETWK